MAVAAPNNDELNSITFKEDVILLEQERRRDALYRRSLNCPSVRPASLELS
jgi:hypothetical protein